MHSTRPLRYLSLFSGIGGFEVGIRAVFPDAECVGFSEVDEDALRIYEHHFPDHTYLGPVQDVTGRYDVDLIVAGSPCKDLSKLRANNEQKGLDGKESGLFFEFLRIYNENKPCYFILENVGSMPQTERDRISAALNCQPVLLDSQFVSAQRRKRYFWTNFPLSEFPPEMKAKAPSLSSVLVDEQRARSDALSLAKDRNYRNYQSRIQRGLRVSGYYQVSKSAQPKSKTLTTIYRTWIQDDRIGTVRKMDAREAERLQTFPEGWIGDPKIQVQCKVLGNAVTCKVIQYVCEHLKRYLDSLTMSM